MSKITQLKKKQNEKEKSHPSSIEQDKQAGVQSGQAPSARQQEQQARQEKNQLSQHDDKARQDGQQAKWRVDHQSGHRSSENGGNKNG